MNVSVIVKYKAGKTEDSLSAYEDQAEFGINVPNQASEKVISKLAKERCIGVVSQRQGISPAFIHPQEVTLQLGC